MTVAVAVAVAVVVMTVDVMTVVVTTIVIMTVVITTVVLTIGRMDCRVLDIADLQNAELWQKAGLLGPTGGKQPSMQPDSDRQLFADALNQQSPI